MQLRWLLAGLLAVERAGVGVVPQFHGPGEVVIELNAVDLAALHDLADQPEEPRPHPRVSGVEPDHLLAMHGHAAFAGAVLQHPVGVFADHRGIRRLHQAVLKPGDHPQTASVGGLGEAANRIELGGALE